MEIEPVLLYRFTNWANDLVIAGARQLTPEQLNSPIRPDFYSTFGLLVHIMAAERIWLSRWLGESPRVLIKESDIPDLDALETAWTPLRAEMLNFVSSAGSTNQVLTYSTTRGVEYQDILWHLILHVVNHGTEHRSQAALYMAMLGIDLGGLDLIIYIRDVLPGSAS
jgi:uncharacterized damage-inducible protein DinB